MCVYLVSMLAVLSFIFYLEKKKECVLVFYLCVYLGITCLQCPQRLEGGARAPGTGVRAVSHPVSAGDPT